MKTFHDDAPKKESRAVANSFPEKARKGNSPFQVSGDRPVAISRSSMPVQGMFFSTPLTGIFKNLYSSDLWNNIPGLSSLYGFVPGESHHKRIAKTVFNNLPEGARQMDWSHHQTNLERKVERATGGAGVDAKIRNDIYVANIIKDQEMMREAVQFGLEISNVYGPGGSRSRVINKSKGEMDHVWPDQDTSGTKNTVYRGWRSVLSSLNQHYTPGFAPAHDYLSRALGDNRDKLQQLSEQKKPYNLEQAMYILRVMGQMRDIMKAEKKPGGKIPEFLSRNDNTSKFNRIRISGQGTRENRDVPEEHSSSRSFMHRFMQPLGSYMHKDDAIYKVQNPKKGEPPRFDYLQGTSGTTIDMINFFLSHGKDKNEATRLMQVFYANWHLVAPDGNAHSQSESIGTMLQYLHRANLQSPIMAPIRGGADVESMINPMKGRKKNVKKRDRYANRLTSTHPGYLYKT